MTFVDLSGRADIPVPEEVVAALLQRSEETGLRMLVVGAAARDLVIHSQLNERPARSTLDIDVAVAVWGDGDFGTFCAPFDRARGGEHTFRVCGVEVDIVPYGGIESSRAVSFEDGHVLDVTGLEEAARTAVRVRMPQGTEVPVAGLPAQAALKVLAWRDRHRETRKDAVDLATILDAASRDPFDAGAWDDTEAMEAADFDIVEGSAFHVGKLAAAPFSPADGAGVLAVLEGVESRCMLMRDMRSHQAETLLAGFTLGFDTGLGRESPPDPN